MALQACVGLEKLVRRLNKGKASAETVPRGETTAMSATAKCLDGA